MIKLYPEQNRRRIILQLVWFLLWVGVTGVALYLTPSSHGHGTHTQLGFAACPSVMIFDRPCPGCGLTTSFTNMVHLRFADAFRAHWLGPFMYLIFTGSAWVCLWAFIKRMFIYTNSKAFNWTICVLTGIFLLYGFTRFGLTKLHSPFYAGGENVQARDSH